MNNNENINYKKICYEVLGGFGFGMSYIFWRKMHMKPQIYCDLAISCAIGYIFPPIGISLGMSVGSYYYMMRKPYNYLKYFKK